MLLVGAAGVWLQLILGYVSSTYAINLDTCSQNVCSTSYGKPLQQTIQPGSRITECYVASNGPLLSYRLFLNKCFSDFQYPALGGPLLYLLFPMVLLPTHV